MTPIFEDDRLFDMEPDVGKMRSLFDEYVMPPFTILDTRQGHWQALKNRIIRFGIESEVGRDEKLTYGKFDNDEIYVGKPEWRNGSTSIFDPVLTGLVYKWFCPEGGTILDPFAGGSVRGVVAAAMGRRYIGIDLSAVQIEANRRQARDLLVPGKFLALGDTVTQPRWVEGDARDILPKMDGARVDLVFTCPPYGDLEVYSDDPKDLSTMTEDNFNDAYQEAIAGAADRLADDRFACIVVGNFRRPDNSLRDFVGQTVRAFENAGMTYYNEAIICNMVGTGAVRARKQMEKSRKMMRLHQTLLVFVKGDARRAATRMPSVRMETPA